MQKKTVIIISVLIILSTVVGYLILSGSFKIQGPPMFYVEPQTSVGTVGQNITISIHASNIANLYGWSLKLGWNTTLLEVVNVTQGSFMESGGETLFNSQINMTTSSVLIYCTLLGNVSGASGSGTLVTIQFTVKESGQCNLDLYDVLLINSSEEQIDATIYDGHFTT